jgi:NTP pyrophosphatase (non-canonical NTP hydrolase)
MKQDATESTESPPRDEVLWFAQEMERKLKVNDYKGHWDNCEFSYLSRRLNQETGELRRALQRFKNLPEGPAYEESAMVAASHVIAEAADVANFAMMIADQIRPWLAKGDRER